MKPKFFIFTGISCSLNQDKVIGSKLNIELVVTYDEVYKSLAKIYIEVANYFFQIIHYDPAGNVYTPLENNSRMILSSVRHHRNKVPTVF